MRWWRSWRVLGLTTVSADGLLPFVLETICAIWALTAVSAAIVRVGSPASSLWLFAPLPVSSTYLLLGWVWPTTELGAIAGYTSMLLLQIVWERKAPPSWTEALLYAAAVLWAGAMRQSRVPLAIGLWAMTAIRVPVCAWLRADVLARLARLALLLIAAAIIVAICFSSWGGLVPPDFRRHSANSLTVVPVFHEVALTSIFGWGMLYLAISVAKGIHG